MVELYEIRLSVGRYSSELKPTLNHSLVYRKLSVELSKNVLGGNRSRGVSRNVDGHTHSKWLLKVIPGLSVQYPSLDSMYVQVSQLALVS